MSRELLVLLALCVLVRLPWILTVPPTEAPDEYTHLWMITFLRDHLRLPTGPEVLAAGPDAVYGSLPQLGYLPHALFTRLASDSQIPLYARFASLLMGMATVWAGWRVGRELFTASRLFALALPLMLIFHPQLVFLHCYANNDATASAVASVVVYMLVLVLKRGPSLKRAASVGALTCWLALCKYSGWTIVPVVFATFGAAAYLHGVGMIPAIASLGVLFLMLAGTTGGWLWRNYQEFSGDWMGTKTMYHTWAAAFHRQLVYHISPLQVINDKRWWRFFLFSFWGMFGYTNRYIWRPLYYIFLGFQVVSLGGWINAFRMRTWSKENLTGVAIWSMLGLCCLLNMAGMVYASTENLGGPQGRYMLISEIPVMAILLSGIARIGGKASRWVVLGLLALTAATCVGAWIMLYLLYRNM